jgi:hypothetical protein
MSHGGPGLDRSQGFYVAAVGLPQLQEWGMLSVYPLYHEEDGALPSIRGGCLEAPRPAWRLRRMVWRIIDGIRRAVQASNCYRLHAPVRHAVILRDCARDAHPSRIAFPKPAAKPAPLLSWREGMAAKVIRAPAAVKTSYPANGAALGAGGYPQSGSAEKTPDYHASLRDRQKPQDSKKDADLRVFQREGWQIPRASLLETGLMRRHLRA